MNFPVFAVAPNTSRKLEKHQADRPAEIQWAKMAPGIDQLAPKLQKINMVLQNLFAVTGCSQDNPETHRGRILSDFSIRPGPILNDSMTPGTASCI